MKEQKRLIIPEDLWDTDLLESWLEEKAAQGWFPVSFGGLRGKFKACEPQDIRFRLEPDKPESPERRQERESIYGEMGWRYVANLGDYRVWCCDDPAAQELYTDPITLNWAWEKQLRRLWRNGLICVLLILLWMAWQLRQIWGGHPVEQFVYGMWAIWLFVLWWGGRGLWDTIRQLRGVRRLRRKLGAGIAPDHTGDVAKALRRRRRREIADWTGIVLLALFCISLAVTGDSGELPEGRLPLPYVTMETLDPESAALDTDWRYYQEDWDVLAPYHCEIQEFRWDFGPRLEARFDRLRVPFLAELLYHERLAATEREIPGLDLTEVKDPRFDEAVLLTGGRIQIFLGRRGTAVLWEYTILNTDLMTHLDEFAAVLTDFQ